MTERTVVVVAVSVAAFVVAEVVEVEPIRIRVKEIINVKKYTQRD